MSPAGAMEAVVVPAPRAREIPRPFHPWFSPVWVAFVTFQWWLQIQSQLAGTIPDRAQRLAIDTSAALGAIGHLAGNAVEALFYVWWWRARARLSFARLFQWLVSISVLDLLASTLTRAAESHPGPLARTLAVLAGIGALRGQHLGASPGLEAAFGSLGLLCVARLVATATLQRRGMGGSLGGPLLLTLAAWLLGRIAIWWLMDLARGMSPLP